MSSILDSVLAAVTQRAFFSEQQIRELTGSHYATMAHALYGKHANQKASTQPDELRALKIFRTDTQQTWLVVNQMVAFHVLDDRKWEEPRVRIGGPLKDMLPVTAKENWSEGSGALYFGHRTQAWLYSKDLFQTEPVVDVVTRFLTEGMG
jgi:hypothetical protein